MKAEIIITGILLFGSCTSDAQDSVKIKLADMEEKIVRSESEWREILTPEQYFITRQKGTERAFTGQYHDFFEKGVYKCIGCEAVLFDSSSKFQSGCGWPSFSDIKSVTGIILKRDTSYGMIRTEVICKKCDAHLGHVFNDGPPPTGLRYCINSVAIKFEKQ